MKRIVFITIVFLMVVPVSSRAQETAQPPHDEAALLAEIETVNAAMVEKQQVMSLQQKASQAATDELQQLEARRLATEQSLAQAVAEEASRSAAAARAARRARYGSMTDELGESFDVQAAHIFLGSDEHVDRSWREAEEEFARAEQH